MVMVLLGTVVRNVPWDPRWRYLFFSEHQTSLDVGMHGQPEIPNGAYTFLKESVFFNLTGPIRLVFSRLKLFCCERKIL